MAEKRTEENGKARSLPPNTTGTNHTESKILTTAALETLRAATGSGKPSAKSQKTRLSEKQKKRLTAICGLALGAALALSVTGFVLALAGGKAEKPGTAKKVAEETSSKSEPLGKQLALIEEKAEKISGKANESHSEISSSENYPQKETAEKLTLPQNGSLNLSAEKVFPDSLAETELPKAILPQTAEPASPKAILPEDKKNHVLEQKGSEKNQDVSAGGIIVSGKRDQPFSQPSLADTIPQAANGANLVFVFDDGGQSLSQLEHFVTLPFPVTVAVLPRLANSSAAASRIRASGNEVILHQPMQAVNLKIKPGAGAILPDMSAAEIVATMKANIAEIGPVSGVNNHEGSLISEDEFKMARVLETAKESGLFYLDSRTTSQSRVAQAALAVGVGYYERNVFLDNTKKRDDILREIRRGLDIANKKGCAIMIGHIWSADVLPAILRELHPILKSKGYSFSTVSGSNALIAGS